ncbi:Hypothetical predicted protein [Mytilus galloprovincialis]|uniref:B box-type domain-containing protein n=1 Tax=Mytilus galloprovincialis TaxID=29158 RepID=A0A8B6HE34_MYTGA|nr:Hypothetical predicted protein [Mytilus galloprovincialis]
MASKLNISCGSCGYEEISKNAKKWCTICEEGFCEDCERYHKSMKLSRDHKMISIEDYRQIENISVNLNCEIHGKKLDLYCKKHDIAVCVVCIPLEHKSCSSSDVISIDDATENAKQSSALLDLEGTISATIDNVKHCIKNREIALKNVDQDEQTIRKTITDTRKNINEYLDKLERKLLLDLKSKHGNCKSKIVKILNQLRQMEKEVEKLKEQTLQMKRFASDLQVFLGTRQLNQSLCKQIGSLKGKIRDYTNNNIEIEVNHVISSFMNEAKQFGEIRVSEAMVELQLKDAKIDQAQIQIHGLSQNIQNVSLKLKQKFDIKGSEKKITGCIVLPDNRIIMADYYGGGNLMEYNNDGKHIRDIPNSNRPFSLTAIDTDCIAATYGDKQYLEIINTTCNSERKKVQCSNHCWGISYQDQKLYVVVFQQGIVVMDLNGKTLNTIDIDVSGVFNITTTSDRIYYTDTDSDTVHCCSVTGQEIWVFKDQSISCLVGLSVDMNQNVFLVGQTSNNLTVIQHDGKDRKVLLTGRDGLEYPFAVNYNKQKKMICLGYKTGSLALYQMS